MSSIEGKSALMSVVWKSPSLSANSRLDNLKLSEKENCFESGGISISSAV